MKGGEEEPAEEEVMAFFPQEAGHTMKRRNEILNR